MTRLSTTAPIARTLLGAAFFVFGLNGFLGFLPQPPQPAEALPFLGGLASAGYFFPLLKGLEVLAGIALLSNRFVGLALAVLAPIVVQIFAFHAFLAPAGLPLALGLLAFELFLAWSYRDAYRPMLAANLRIASSVRTPVELGTAYGPLSSHS